MHYQIFQLPYYLIDSLLQSNFKLFVHLNFFALQFFMVTFWSITLFRITETVLGL